MAAAHCQRGVRRHMSYKALARLIHKEHALIYQAVTNYVFSMRVLLRAMLHFLTPAAVVTRIIIQREYTTLLKTSVYFVDRHRKAVNS